VPEHTHVRNFQISVQRFCKPQKLSPKAVFWTGACYELRAQMAQFWAIEIISGAFAITAPLLISFDFASLLKQI